MNYREYIQSEAWKQKRAEAFRIHGRICCKCASTKRLVVHHKTYDRFGNEDVERDLEVQCEDCHNVHHGGSPRRPKPCRKNSVKWRRETRKQRYAKLYRPWIKADRERANRLGIKLPQRRAANP